MAITQWIIVGIYSRWMKRLPAARPSENQPELETLKVAVIVCVRGGEPKLKRNLLSIVQQTHTNNVLHLVVDSVEDSAYPVLEDLSREFPDKVRIHLLELSNSHAGLKPLGLSQVCRLLLKADHPPDCFVFSDADTLHVPSWISRLLGQLYSHHDIGAVTGQRWYLHSETQRERVGTTVRRLWNIASLPQMYFYEVVWGGSWAVRADALPRHK